MNAYTKETREKLAKIARNIWWSWNPEAIELFREVNPVLFEESGHNPLRTLKYASPVVLSNADFQARVDRVWQQFEAYMHQPIHPEAPRVAYFCMEYGLHESIQIYAGGLGILAGDHVKAASDLGVPMVAVGIFWRKNYLTQRFNEEGWQIDVFEPSDPSQLPLELVRDAEGNPLRVTVHFGRTPVHVQAWKLAVGRTVLYLLDTDIEENTPEVRTTTHKLYDSGESIRIQQEIVLGIAGVRLLRALGHEVDVYHMNEGHCAFLTLELLRERLAEGHSLEEAEAWVKLHCVFTTHTPIAAGHDRFAPGMVMDELYQVIEDLEPYGLDEHRVLAYGRVQPENPFEPFCMTVLAIKFSRVTNGVSKLHGEVSRHMWHELWPDRPVQQVPITHVTNGVHLPTWTVKRGWDFLNKHLGDWLNHRSDPAFWERVQEIPEDELWEYRNQLRRELIEFVYEQVPRQTLKFDLDLDPDALTIGFARRMAPYKRATLLFTDPERAARLFSLPDKPVQILFAGKAHPMNQPGKSLIHRIYEISQMEPFKGKVIFLENYNMAIARFLVSGSDVWLNNPRRPFEASGTSGQKVATHAGVNVSVLDGWWPEGYDGTNGWAIGEATPIGGDDLVFKDSHVQDVEDALALYEVMEQEVIPTFYQRNEQGIPVDWLQRVKRAMITLPPRFSAERMLKEYVERIYPPSVVLDPPRTLAGGS